MERAFGSRESRRPWNHKFSPPLIVKFIGFILRSHITGASSVIIQRSGDREWREQAQQRNQLFPRPLKFQSF